MRHDEYAVDFKINLEGERNAKIEHIYDVYGEKFVKRNTLVLIDTKNGEGQYRDFYATYEDALQAKMKKINNDVAQYVKMLKKDIKDLQHKHNRIGHLSRKI